MIQHALDDRVPSVPKTQADSRDKLTLAEKRSDPENISRIPYSLEHENAQKRNIYEREDERQGERVDQERLGVILWLSGNWDIGGNHGHNEGNERA